MLRNYIKKLLFMIIDFCMVLAAYLLVILLVREDFVEFIRTPEVFLSAFVTGIGIIIALNAVNFYSSLWMYTSIKEYTLGMLGGIGAVSVMGLVTGFFGEYFLKYRYPMRSGKFENHRLCRNTLQYRGAHIYNQFHYINPP